MSVPKLRFKEFDGDWTVQNLGDSFSLISGYAFPSSASVDSGARWLKIADVGIQEMTPNNPSYLPLEYLSKYSQFIVNKNEYVIALTRPILNKKLKVAKVGDFYDGALLNQRVAKIASSKNDLDFIYSLLQKSKTVEELENSIAGTDPPNLSLNDVKEIKLGFPSKEEQTKIASFVSAVDEKINQLTQKHELLSRYKQGMMQKLFSQQIHFKADDGSEFEEWEEKTLLEVADIVGGGTPSTNQEEYWNGDVVWLTPSEIDRKFIGESKRTISKLGVQKSSAKILPIGTILFTSRATIGEVAISTKELTTNQGFQSFIVKQNIINEYLYYWVIHNKKKFIERASGSTFLEISKSKMQPMEILLPCLAEQTKIAHFLSAIDQKIEVVAQQIEQAKQWKKGLLQQMFV